MKKEKLINDCGGSKNIPKFEIHSEKYIPYEYSNPIDTINQILTLNKQVKPK